MQRLLLYTMSKSISNVYLLLYTQYYYTYLFFKYCLITNYTGFAIDRIGLVIFNKHI